ncbi:tyrosine-type recombinase/integrase [Gracilibacillus sp. YIM 98692]|uniref:tyrosine-type recombinase/integrase n=1 Tax=Gracilibacillus sp. YIM 98692 TaxID=2663532 RepID=UPI0013D8A682|nr:tyrosine-type recombinase/integrase [Gracilibacillus sp. YIM 98692]
MARRRNKLTSEDLTPQKQAPIYGAEDFESALHLFLRDCKVRNLSEHTVKYYRNELIGFRNMLERQKVDTEPHKITEVLIKEKVILYMMEELGRKDVTINSKLRAIRAFFNFLYNESYIIKNPVANISLIKQKKTIIETFSRDQLRLLMAQPDQSTFTGMRDYTILLFLLETGVRARELIDISVSDINWQDNVVRINGKGSKERHVPIQSTMKTQLRKYVNIRGKLEHDALFVTIDDTSLTKRQLQNRIALYGRRASIKDVRCSPHTFRHTFAKMSVQNGADVFHLQAVLGHTSMDMVRNYVNLFSRDVFNGHRKFSPVEKLV